MPLLPVSHIEGSFDVQIPAIDVSGIDRSFGRGERVLKNISLRVRKGEMVALIGASGSGKSTLMRSIAGLIPVDRPRPGSDGQIRLFGQSMQDAGRIGRDAKALRSRVGVVFQQFNLVPRLSVLTNVCVGLLGRVPRWRGTLGWFTTAEKQQAVWALNRVGIAEHALKRGSALSGGQQQRAAIARSLVQGAELLMADEPIASLDPNSARRVMDILAALNASDGITVVVSLHQVEYALRYCPRTVALRAGEIVYDGPSSALTPAFLAELYGAESGDILVPSLGGAPIAGGWQAVAAPEHDSGRAPTKSRDLAGHTLAAPAT